MFSSSAALAQASGASLSGPLQSNPSPPPASVTVPATPEGSVGPAAARLEVTAFDIQIEAPSEVRALLERHLQLQRYRAVTDLDDVELARLMTLADGDVRNLVGTLGYFSPEISIRRSTAAGERLVIVIAVDPGKPTQTADVAIAFSGHIVDSADVDAQTQRTEIRRNWRLPVNRRFTQEAWDGAKLQALRELVARRSPAGKVSYSLADIDAPAATASLALTLDSGPLYRLGPLQISGAERYDPVLVERLSRLKSGDIYDQRRLVEAQQRLVGSGYFDSASIVVDSESPPGAAPVQVQVREAKLQKVILGLGLTSDSGPRASIEHTHQRVPGIDWRAVNKFQLERRSPYLQSEWTAMPDADNWRWAALARAERLDDNEFITSGQRLRFGRTQAGDRIDRNIYVQYDRANVRGSSAASTSATDAGDGSSLSANYVWTGRYFDSLPFPGQGYGMGLELGGGTTLGQSRQPYARVVGRWLGIRPLQRGRIALRAEAGTVLASGQASIPATQLFRTGGDSSVRGYGLREIGVRLANGSTGPGRYLALASAEWQRPIFRGGLPSEWESTLFIDAGNVAEKSQALRDDIAFGIGGGVRWRSPIGPLQVDLAYGTRVKRVRLHLSVGFVF